MQIKSINIKNFRQFGSDGCLVNFRKGLTVLVGENDAGKSAIIDALRYAMGTTDMRWNRILPSDVFDEDVSRTIHIQVCFNSLTDTETALLLEYLTYEDEPVVYLNWSCHFNLKFTPARPIVEVTSGKLADGPTFIADARELFRATYLKPLRDAYLDMQAGKGSRLSQVIKQVPDLDKGDTTYTEGTDIKALSLPGIFDLTNYLLENFGPLIHANKLMTEILKRTMLINGEQIKTKLEVANSNVSESQKVLSLLEKIGLNVDHAGTEAYGVPGLGTSNIMSMACELLLQKQDRETSQFTLIEEPEAHIHPQRQMKLIRSLEDSATDSNHQIIVTSHSPLLASVVHLEDLIVIKSGKAFPMDSMSTKLKKNDYGFLERFLDATKANLFFANSVIVVEGSGEELLLPTVAKLLGRNLVDHGVSIVNVMGKGLSHFSDIFKRTDNSSMGVNVACITDRDVEPDVAPDILNQDKKSKTRQWYTETELRDSTERQQKLQQRVDAISGGDVQAFMADHWTLEYDLASTGWSNGQFQQMLIRAAGKANGVQEATVKKWEKELAGASTTEEKATRFYKHVRNRKAEFANYLSDELETEYRVLVSNPETDKKYTDLAKLIPTYLVRAIGYVTGGEIKHAFY